MELDERNILHQIAGGNLPSHAGIFTGYLTQGHRVNDLNTKIDRGNNIFECGQVKRYRGIAHLPLAPFAYVCSLRKVQYEASPELRDIGRYSEVIRNVHMRADQLEERLGVEFDWLEVGPRGHALSDKDSVGDSIN